MRSWRPASRSASLPFGLAALDMVRIEAGLVFAGCEFCDQTDPFEAGIGFTVPLKSKTDDFIGREALERRKAHPVRRLVGLDLEGGLVPSTGDCVRVGRAQVGEITSAVRSPILGRVIALCRMDVTCAARSGHESRGRAARRSPEAHPGPGRSLPPLRPGEAAGSRRLRLTRSRPVFTPITRGFPAVGGFRDDTRGPRTSPAGSAGCSPSPSSRSRSRKARSADSSGRTARERPPPST